MGELIADIFGSSDEEEDFEVSLGNIINRGWLRGKEVEMQS